MPCTEGACVCWRAVARARRRSADGQLHAQLDGGVVEPGRTVGDAALRADGARSDIERHKVPLYAAILCIE
jgi:hypothetical protein